MTQPWAQGDAAQQAEEREIDERMQTTVRLLLLELAQRHDNVDEAIGVLGSMVVNVIGCSYKRRYHDEVVRTFYKTMRDVMELKPKRRQ